MKKLISISTALILTAALSAAHAAGPKLGYVDAARLLEEAPQAQEATSGLKDEFAPREEEIARAQEEIRRLEESLSRDSAVMSESERRKLGMEVLSRKRELRRMQEEFREDVNIRRSDTVGNLQELIKEAIEEVGSEGGYDLIFFEGIAFANPDMDITDRVLEGMKRRHEEMSSGTR